MLQRPQTLLFLAAAIVSIFTIFAPIATFSPDFTGIDSRVEKMNPSITVGASSIEFSMDYVQSVFYSQKRYKNEVIEGNKVMNTELEKRGLSRLFQLGIIGSMLLIAAIIALVFLFKNRKLQIRLGIFLTLICMTATAGIFIASKIGLDLFAELKIIPRSVANLDWQVTYEYGFFMFPATAILLLAGVLLVRKDDNLVKSLDRLR